MSANVRNILETHEAALLARLKDLREQIIPLERELAEVRRARAALEVVRYGPEQTQIVFPDPNDGRQNAHEVQWRNRVVHAAAKPPSSPYATLTIKDLIKKALTEQFERGASANELLDFFEKAWGRSDIVRTSLSPQLSRLKQEGVISLINQRWKLTQSATAETKAAVDQ